MASDPLPCPLPTAHCPLLPGWSRVTVAGKLADVFEPPQPSPFALIYLHAESGETPANNATITKELASRRLRCVAPIAARSWWVDRVCPEFDPALTAERHVRENVPAWVAANWRVGPRSIGVVGVEMGGQGAVRLGLKYPDLFPVVGSINGAFDFHERYGQGTPLDEMYPSRERCRQDTAVLHVPPLGGPDVWFACAPTDRWYRGNDRLHEKLSAVGMSHTAELETVQDADRWIAPMLAFVISSLERVSRRLM